MRFVSFLFTISVLLFFSIRLQAAELTEANITTTIANGEVDQADHAYDNPTLQQKIVFFKVIDLIRNGISPDEAVDKRNLITKLRECLNHPNLSRNLKSTDEKAVDNIKERLMEEEINLFRRFGFPDANLMPGEAGVEEQLAIRTKGLSKMVGELVARNGSGTGTLIAIPNVDGGHIWAVLTCGHILDDVGCDKNDANDNDELNFQLKRPDVAATVRLKIKRIKVFKRPEKSFQITDIGHLPINPENSVTFPDHIRALPRYDVNGDLALCFFDEAQIVTAGQNIQQYLDAQFTIPDANQPTIQDGPIEGLRSLRFTITQAEQDINYILPFVDDNQTPLRTNINTRNKAEMFALGYAGFDGQVYPTLSGTRNLERLQIYSKTINNAGSTIYNFYHDIPTYSGMSGGPIFHVDAAANTVTIFGIVLGHNDGASSAMKSRCEGSFLKQSLLE